MIIEVQPAPVVDNIVNGHEMTQLPYPFFVDQDGEVGRQDFWRGDPARIIGFQKDLAVQRVDLWWDEVVEDPSAAVGMYVVSQDKHGDIAVHQIAVQSMTVLGEAQSGSQAPGTGHEG